MSVSAANELMMFSPISLLEMEGVKLLDRIDTKYVFSFSRLPYILSGLHEQYSVLEVNGIRENKYETLYFDTEKFKLYLDHHNGKLNRYKVRCRKYADSGLVYFEIKYKNSKGRTFKSRVEENEVHISIEGKSNDMLIAKTPFTSSLLQPKLWVNYSRITLVNKYSTERLTIDINLEMKSDTTSRTFDGVVIAEVKQAKVGSSPFIDVMKSNYIREGSISKYCYGVIALFDHVKKNNFKTSLLNVLKISNDAKSIQ